MAKTPIPPGDQMANAYGWSALPVEQGGTGHQSVVVNAGGQPPIDAGSGQLYNEMIEVTKKALFGREPREEQIEFRPMASPVRLPFTGTDFRTVRDALKGTFGPFPIRLTRDRHRAVLRGMKFAAGSGSAPYDMLEEALEKFADIEVVDL